MAYTKVFTNPHPNGWDNPSERPPITADVLQAHTDAIQAIDNYLAAGGGAGGGGGGDYILPVATKTILGGVKVDGDTIAVTSDGTISVTASGGAIKNTSDLTNDGSGSGSYFVEASELAQVAFAGNWSALEGKPTIPTKTSQLTNDSNFLSAIPKATTTILGGIKLDGETLTMDTNGVVSVVGGASGGASYLVDLKDTNILSATIQDGDVLTYNSETSTWTNSTIDLGAGSRELTLAEYDALTAEEKADGTDYYITDAEEMDELLVSTSNTYSLDEKVVGRWINGKPIYQKTIESFPDKVSNTIENWANYVEDIISIHSILKITGESDTDVNYREVPAVGSENTIIVEQSASPTHIYTNLGTHFIENFSGRVMYTTVQYTKTVDLIPSEFSYEGAYSDSSPVTYTFDREMILAGIKVKCPGVKGTSGLWQPGTVTYEVQLEEDGDWVTILTDTSSTTGVWGGSGNGNFTYNREYILPRYLEVYGLRITFTGVYRVSADITITEMVP